MQFLCLIKYHPGVAGGEYEYMMIDLDEVFFIIKVFFAFFCTSQITNILLMQRCRMIE